MINISKIYHITSTHLNLAGTFTCSKNDRSIYFLGVYRPPDSNKLNFVQELEQHISLITTTNVIVIGYMNINILNQSDKYVQAYDVMFATHGFINYIRSETREEFRSDKLCRSCIDHIYVRSKLVEITSAIYISKFSDHYMTAIALHCDDYDCTASTK